MYPPFQGQHLLPRLLEQGSLEQLEQPSISATIGQPSSQPAKLCGVCGMPSAGIRCGAQACDACKKFFLRNRNNLANLECITSRGDCMALNQSYAADLLVRRQYCSRCRLQRCFEIGMRYFGRTGGADGQQQQQQRLSSSTSSSNISSSGETMLTVDLTQAGEQPYQHQPTSTISAVKFAPSRHECSAAEVTLKMVTVAVADLCTFQSMPWTVSVGNFPNDCSLWLHAMVNFNYIVEHGADYVKSLTGITSMPVCDRVHLFSRSLVPHLVAQVTLPNHNDYRLFGMAPALRHKFMRFFPVFKNCEDISEEITSVMEEWDPSFAEFALLQAMVFFRSDKLEQLRRPQVVVTIYQQLQQSLEWYLAHDKNYYLRKHYFMRVYNLLRYFEDSYSDTIIRLSNDRPDLVHYNRTFAEIYNLPPIEREEQYRRLGLPPLETCLLTKNERQPTNIRG